MEETTTEAIVQKKSKKAWFILGIPAAILLAAYLTVCILAANTATIYPGRTMRGIAVGGLSVPQAAEKLEAEFPKQSVTFRPHTDAPDSAMEPLTLPYAAFGAGLEYEMAARIAHKEFHPGNFFSNGWDYFSCWAGLPNQPDWCDLTLEEAAFDLGKAQLLSKFFRAPGTQPTSCRMVLSPLPPPWTGKKFHPNRESRTLMPICAAPWKPRKAPTSLWTFFPPKP